MARTMITKRHNCGGGCISLPFVTLADVPEKITAGGYELSRKSEFHVSLMALDKLAAMIDASDIDRSAEALKQSFVAYAETHDLTDFHLTGQYRLVKKDKRVTVVALVDFDGIEGLFDFLREKHGVDFPTQPTHITVYTLQPDAGIGIVSDSEMAQTEAVDMPELGSCRAVEFSEELYAALAIAYRAGEVMRTYFYCDQQCVTKKDGSPVTVADKAINRLTIEELARLFPADGVIGEEESTTSYGSGRKWFCDPVDGTRAYTWGLPSAMFSLALVIDGVPTVGVAYDPFLDRMFYAQKGLGAFCNTAALKVSSQSLSDGILAITSNPQKIRQSTPYLDEIFRRGITTASFSGAVYKCCLVAFGRLCGYFQEGVGAYDMAASQVIVMEAGGKVTDLDGRDYDYTRPFHGTITSNGVVHDELVALLRNR